MIALAHPDVTTIPDVTPGGGSCYNTATNAARGPPGAALTWRPAVPAPLTRRELPASLRRANKPYSQLLD